MFPNFNFNTFIFTSIAAFVFAVTCLQLTATDTAQSHTNKICQALR